jgi:glutathione S-transferase
MALTIHGICISPFARKVFIMAETLGLEYDNVVITPMNKPDNLIDISPLLKIPVLSDGDLNLADSSIICDYLNNKYGDNTLYPADPALRAQALWLEEYADTKLFELLGGIFYERVIAPKYKEEPTDEDRVNDIINNQLPPVFDYLQSKLPDSGFMFGELSIGDVAIASQFINASYGQFKVDGKKWPKLSAYIAALFAHPSFAKRMAHDQKLFS